MLETTLNQIKQQTRLQKTCQKHHYSRIKDVRQYNAMQTQRQLGPQPAKKIQTKGQSHKTAGAIRYCIQKKKPLHEQTKHTLTIMHLSIFCPSGGAAG